MVPNLDFRIAAHIHHQCLGTHKSQKYKKNFYRQNLKKFISLEALKIDITVKNA